MLNNLSKTTNIMANSVINDELAATMRATVNSNNTWNIVKNVRDTELFLSNQEQCDADYAEFEKVVLEFAQE